MLVAFTVDIEKATARPFRFSSCLTVTGIPSRPLDDGLASSSPRREPLSSRLSLSARYSLALRPCDVILAWLYVETDEEVTPRAIVVSVGWHTQGRGDRDEEC